MTRRALARRSLSNPSLGRINGSPGLSWWGCAPHAQAVLGDGIVGQADIHIIRQVSEARFAPNVINVLDEPLADPDALKPGVVGLRRGFSLSLREARDGTAMARGRKSGCHGATE